MTVVDVLNGQVVSRNFGKEPHKDRALNRKQPGVVSSLKVVLIHMWHDYIVLLVHYLSNTRPHAHVPFNDRKRGNEFVAVCCSVLQRFAVCCSVLQRCVLHFWFKSFIYTQTFIYTCEVLPDRKSFIFLGLFPQKCVCTRAHTHAHHTHTHTLVDNYIMPG